MATVVTKGDTANNLIRVRFNNNILGFIPVKAVFQLGSIRKTVDNPESPFYLSFTRQETKKFTNPQYCHCAFYGENDEKYTSDGFLKFCVRDEVVKDE